jgi:hypothetical protein
MSGDFNSIKEFNRSMNKTSKKLNSSSIINLRKGSLMKNTTLSPEGRLVKNGSSAIREFNVAPIGSQLKIEDYQKLLVSYFVNHVKVEDHGLNRDEYMYRDGYIISTIKESLTSIRFEAEYWKALLRGYKVAFIRDKNGFSFSLIVFPRKIDKQIDSDVIKGMTNSLSDCFYTEASEEQYRTVFKLIPRVGSQTELMKAYEIPMFALSLGLELDVYNKKFEIFFYTNEKDRIDSLGNYREF